MNNQKINKRAFPKPSPKSLILSLGNFLRRGKLTDKPNSQEVIMQHPSNPRMRNLDTVLDRSRFIWERTASNNN